MKRLCFFIIVCLGCPFLYTQEYQISEIEDIAYSFFNQSPQYAHGINGNLSTRDITSVEAIVRDSVNYMYIVNTENPIGWVILSNEKRYPTIIAHGDSGSFTYNEDELPPALIGILNCHMNIIDSVRNNHLQPNVAESLTENITISRRTNSFLVDNKWKQGLNSNGLNADCEKSYNKFCPEIKKDSCSGRSKTCNRKLVGCGALAMAQIMKYWQWPNSAKIDDVVYYYDWENMPNQINNNTEMYLVDEVARLLENCRTAAKSFGICSATGALVSNVHDAMIEIFGYHSNLVYDYEDVYVPTMLINEIDQGRPILVQGWGDLSIHIDEIEAHYFVVDGYKIEGGDTTFHVNFGTGNPKYDEYYDLNFDQYYRWQKYLIELYPDCSSRSDDISLSNNFTIAADDNRTYYSTSDVILCSNNNSIIVENGGHLLIKAGNEVRLKSGFHAKAGSNVHVMINDTLCNSPQYASPQRLAPRSSSAPADNTEPTDEGATSNSLENVESNMIQSTAIYTISGQLLQTIEGGQRDAAHLPNGMYILQHRMSDGSMKSEKIANYK